MIEILNLRKSFGSVHAINGLTCTIPSGCIMGMVGANGAGKSTLLRILAGVYKADEGSVKLFGEEIYDNVEAKKHIVYVPDTMPMADNSASMKRMAKFYSSCYENFDYAKFEKLAGFFKLNISAKIKSFSKGMIKQAQNVLALSCNADITMLDETFDGLDPIVRNEAKKLIYAEVCDRNATIIITSHSLRELEDTCDRLAMIYNGKLIMQSDVNDLKTHLFKVQLAFNVERSREDFKGFEVVSFEKNGSVMNLIIRGERDIVEEQLRKMDPILIEMLPLSLEEVFTYEMDALGYKFEEIL